MEIGSLSIGVVNAAIGKDGGRDCIALKQVEEGMAFSGRKTKTARSQGKKVQITIQKEYSRLLGNLAWAYMQQKDFKSAEEHYRESEMFISLEFNAE
ncbi:hypothetical protein SASPL_113370 [Salvia splendens]|uniref:Uncharacterized protein n=1 Tax=Salvia splendens TaxID=180675 RepID=A0A8X8ZYB1_SALSN|nr:hypothetical protein SASPL_113370 [Salvia splendens]